jgi:hypothetical protein
MKTQIQFLLTILTLLGSLGLQAQTATFTYQGRLAGTNGPVTGTANLTFRIFTASSGGAQLWQETTNGVPVADGLFAVELGNATPIIGPVLDGIDRWLEIVVNGTLLANRQKLTHAPYAVRSRESATANLAAAATTVANGGVATASLQDNAVTSSKISDATITAADVNAASFSNTFWKVDGNAGIISGTHFLGTTDHQPVELRVNNQPVWRVSPTTSNATVNLVAGSPLNFIEPSVIAATIAGGGTPDWAGATRSNAVAANFATVGGGADNHIAAGAPSAVVAGGFGNRIGNGSGDSTVGGGSFNTIGSNTVFATIAGGSQHAIGAGLASAVVGGGFGNQIRDGSTDATISGGAFNTIASNAFRGTIGGGIQNWAGAPEATVAGGALNSALGFSSTIGGGGGNSASGPWSAIAGGRDNIISNTADYATIGGGHLNTLGTNADYGVIAGGRGNVVEGHTWYSLIGGGRSNRIEYSADFSAISGGEQNLVQANAYHASIGGGFGNTIQSNSLRSTISGGVQNTVAADYAMIPGGLGNTASGDYSFAAGRQGVALHNGSFVWADSTPTSYASTTNDQFNVRASGGVRFETGGAGMTLDGQPAVVSGGSSAVSFTNLANVFAGSGAALQSLNASELTIGTVPEAALDNAWKIEGNAGTIPGPHFLGTVDNQPLDFRVRNMRAFRLEPDPLGAPNVIGGSSQNYALAGVRGVAVGGGDQNTVGSAFAGIGAGYLNTIGTNAAHSTISGGNVNSIANNSFRSALGGGEGNTINASDSTIPGGVSNEIQENAHGATIGGGVDNSIGTNSPGSLVSGGFSNSIGEFNWSSSIGGGSLNSIRMEADFSAIGGGYLNLIGSNAEYNVIGGGFANSIQTNAAYAVIAGGQQNWIDHNADYGAIGGGRLNTVESNAQYSVIGGGRQNQIRTNVFYGFIGSGLQNQMAGGGAVIAGGQANKIQTNAVLGVIVGGASNEIEADATAASIGGGQQNRIGPDADYAFVGGGRFSVVASNGQYGVVGGGYFNRVEANALYATVPGGSGNVAEGVASFAAGYQARAQHDGSWVWADYQPALGSFVSTTSNQFNVRASGGVLLETSGAGMTVDGQSVFTGTDGSGLISLNASQLTSGTVADARLSSNVAQRNATQTFTGANSFLGNVGIGTIAPATALTVATGLGYGIEHTDGTRRLGTYLDAGGGWLGTVSTDPLHLFVNNGGSAMTIDLSSRVGIGRTPTANALEVNGDASKTTAGSWLANSDARIKTEVLPVTGALETLDQVRLVSFRYTDDYRENHPSVEDRRYLNVVAQEFQKVFPEHVKTSGEHLPDGSEVLQVDTYPLTIYSAAAIQELNQKLERRETELAQLKQELEKLKQLVDKLINANH